MTSPEFGGIQPRPEFDHEKPTDLFSYALAKWKRNENIKPVKELGEAQEYLVLELNEFLDQKFGRLPEERPDVTVYSETVYHTQQYNNPITGVDVFESGELPLEGDNSILGKHYLHGSVHSFFISPTQNDLRLYISNPSEPVLLDGGIYTPLLSVPVDGADIEFSAYTIEQKLKTLDDYIYKTSVEQSEEVRELTGIWKSLMEAPNETTIKKLQNSSYVMGEIAKYDPAKSELVPALLERMTLQFDLELPHAIKTKTYRIRVRMGYTQAGPEHFENVTPNISLMGESVVRKKLGLTFQHDKGLIEIPVEDIEAIYKIQKGGW